jgi:hypothetical protein
MERGTTVAASCLALLAFASLSARAQQNPEEAKPELNVLVAPIAELRLLDPALMTMDVPPAGTTLPGARVRFEVRGNATASVSAKPDAFIEVPDLGNAFIGRAVLENDDDELGYDLVLRFPSIGPGLQSASLPGNDGEGTAPLTVALNGNTRQGAVDLVADHDWTPHGGIPMPGLYIGEVLLTVTAN